jgi:phosphotransferase system enzyme I (PtsI)
MSASEFVGIPAAPGIAIGTAYIYKEPDIVYRDGRADPSENEAELLRLRAAVEQSAKQIAEISSRAEAGGDFERADILKAHEMFLEDEILIAEMEAAVIERGMFAETAVRAASDKYKKMFDAMDDSYMRERGSDIVDVCLRIIKNILGVPIRTLKELDEERIIIAKSFSPYDMDCVDPALVKAICTETGGALSHSAIIARMYGIPSVTGLERLLSRISEGENLIVDGDRGVVYINPDEALLAKYRAALDAQMKRKEELSALASLPARTSDKKLKVSLDANIGFADDVPAALANGADGIGLFRTEMLYLGRDSLPDEESQYREYRSVAEGMYPRPVTIRTMDVGGDKDAPCIDTEAEANPFLGWRAIRVCLANQGIFRTQLRAILRASAHGKVRLMYPMIAEAGELRSANELLRNCMAELDGEGLPYDTDIEVGVMIETPAAALAADILIKEADFFSIGANDLIQYTMAVDRMNEKVSYLYDPLNISVLRLIKHVIDISHSAGKRIGMCGEMAGNAMFAPLLLGLGLDELSMNSPAIPVVKDAIRKMSADDAEKAANGALRT